MHTRKLIQIALEMLMKSQVPSIQYISLTTINRIFDIYVYHNLFYPGYYESCYVPLSKRILNKQQQQQKQEELGAKEKIKSADANPTVTSTSLVKATKVANAEAAEKSTPSKTVTIAGKCVDYCQCPKLQTQLSQPFVPSYRIEAYRMKERNSTINEDPSSLEDNANANVQIQKSATGSKQQQLTDQLSTSIENKLDAQPQRGVLTKNPSMGNSGLKTFTTRLSGFFRKFSIANASTALSNQLSDSKPDSLANSDNETICTTCNRKVKKVAGSSPLHGHDEGDEENSTAAAKSSENPKDFTSSLLVGDPASILKKPTDDLIANTSGEKQPMLEDVEESMDELEKSSTNSKAKKDDSSSTGAAANSNPNSNYQNQPFKCLANSIEPRFLLQVIQDRLESHRKIDINASTMAGTTMNGGMCGAGQQQTTTDSSKVKCVPSARTINCQHHCVALLATRLFAVLCNEATFQQKLMNSETSDYCFNIIIELLNPNNDPHLLCLMLQALGLLTLHPEYHDLILKYDLPDTIMSLILPGDELFYTNQTTKFAKYVKHLAARVLVYLGLFAKVSNKVNLFDILGTVVYLWRMLICRIFKFFTLNLFVLIEEIVPEQIDLERPQSFENNFIHHMAIGENFIMNMWHLNMAAISIEKLLDDILKVNFLYRYHILFLVIFGLK